MRPTSSLGTLGAGSQQPDAPAARRPDGWEDQLLAEQRRRLTDIFVVVGHTVFIYEDPIVRGHEDKPLPTRPGATKRTDSRLYVTLLSLPPPRSILCRVLCDSLVKQSVLTCPLSLCLLFHSSLFTYQNTLLSLRDVPSWLIQARCDSQPKPTQPEQEYLPSTRTRKISLAS